MKSVAPLPCPPALRNIDHIIVLMLENRSFDSLLGWLYEHDAPGCDPPFAGLSPDLWCPLDSVDSDAIPTIEKVFVKKNGAPIVGTRHIKADPHPPVDWTVPGSDPGEGFRDTNQQLFEHYTVSNTYPAEPTMRGFVNNYVNTIVNGAYRMFGEQIVDPRDIMTCYTPEQVPVLAGLAKAYAVCDYWFSSVPSQTFPNRAFFHAATSCGHVNNGPVMAFDTRTIFNQMQDAIDGGAALRWNVYSATTAATDKVATGVTPPDDSLTSGGQDTSLTRLLMTRLHDARFTSNFQPIDRFFADAKDGTLPNYAFMEPQFFGAGQSDMHPPADIRAGDRFIYDVYTAVRDSPQWEKTLLVITYDEHGGCYDHVPPPRAIPPDGYPGTGGQDGFMFNRLGVRVPTVLVSPWIEAGTVARPPGRTPFEHTSVIATVQKRFGLDGHLTQRDRAAPDLSSVLTRATPRTDRPGFTPQPIPPPSGEPHVNDLHKTVAEELTRLTGKDQAPDQDIHDFIRTAYAGYFGRTHGR